MNPPRLGARSRPADGSRTHPVVHRLDCRLDTASVAQVIEEYEQGNPSAAIARRFGIGKTGVIALLRKHNVPVRQQPMTGDEQAEAVRLYEAGWSLAKVGQRFGRDGSAIRDVLRRLGIDRRDTHGRKR